MDDFDHLAAFEALYLKGGAHMCFINLLDIYDSMIPTLSHMSSTLNESSAVECFKCGNVIENNLQFLCGTATYMYVATSPPSEQFNNHEATLF